MTRFLWLNLLLCVLFSCIATSCTAPIETKKTAGCETSHIFTWPIRQLHDSIPALFQAEDLRQDDAASLVPLFTYQFPESGAKTRRHQVYFMAEAADSALFGKEYFTRATSKNIYLHSFGEAWNSPTYYAAGKPLHYLTDFAIKLDSLGPHQTSVTIQTLHPHVAHGYGGIGGMCGITLLKKEVPVPASKPEECALLAYLIAQLPIIP